MLVGYGESGLDCTAGAEYKRAGETTVEEVIDGGAGDITLRYDDKVLLCHGNSGGPALVGDRSEVAASTRRPATTARRWPRISRGSRCSSCPPATTSPRSSATSDLGYDQVMFINRAGTNGRIAIVDLYFLVADFSDGEFPTEWQYCEPYGASRLLDGFHDTTADVAIAGDFRGLGYDQTVFVNRDVPSFARAMVVDFYDGVAPSNPGFVQTSALASPLLPRIDATDIVLAGSLTSIGRADLVTIEP